MTESTLATVPAARIPMVGLRTLWRERLILQPAKPAPVPETVPA